VGLTALLGTVPVDPDASEARQWVLDELSKPEYTQAQPSWLDQLADALLEWLNSLQFSSTEGPPGSALAVVVVAVLGVAVIAFLVFGLPRLNRRSAASGSLFGDEDNRSAAMMRKAAAAAAGEGDYTTAIAELFRAIARGLVERTVLTVTPGTTAHDFGVRAGAAFPASRDALVTAANSFDAVRYLGRSGTREQYEELLALDEALRTAAPLLEPVRS
jgi:hypothetical protein